MPVTIQSREISSRFSERLCTRPPQIKQSVIKEVIPHTCVHMHVCEAHVHKHTDMSVHMGCGEYCKERREIRVVRDTLGGQGPSFSKAESILAKTQGSDCCERMGRAVSAVLKPCLDQRCGVMYLLGLFRGVAMLFCGAGSSVMSVDLESQ